METNSCKHSWYLECGREFRILLQDKDTGFLEIAASGYCFNASFDTLKASAAGRWLLVKHRWSYVWHIPSWLWGDLWGNLRGKKAITKLALREEFRSTRQGYEVVGSCCAHSPFIPVADVRGSFSGWLFLPQYEGSGFLALAALFMWHKLHNWRCSRKPTQLKMGNS